MDTLRASLEIIFKEMMVGPLLNAAVGQPSFDSQRFIRLFQRRFPSMSLDQCRLSERMVSNYYMLPPEGAVGVPDKSVFNVLLHFNREVLHENKGMPECKFEHLLRWNSLASLLGEDLLTTSFLASMDARHSNARDKFDWGLVIEQDDPDLRELFRREIADVHMHLKGSSSNFDLNWLCLMNHPQSRQKQFRKLAPLQQVNTAAQYEFSPHALAVKACAIRYLLYLQCVKQTNSPFILNLKKVIDAASDIATTTQAKQLGNIINSEHLSTNQNRTMLGHDYAWQVDELAVKNNPNCILAGERRLLYNCFYRCYSGRMDERSRRLLYAYILIKNLIRNELIQTNNVVGFDNFNSYEERKTIFIDNYPAYMRLVEPLAIGQYFFRNNRKRYVEPRITPKDSAKKIHQTISGLDRELGMLTTAGPDDFHYVLHFIKKQEGQPAAKAPLQPRHHLLRSEVRRQSVAIGYFRRSSPHSSRITGIDAANSEIYARPEVFAQAFRYLRDVQLLHNRTVTATLGMTYHVGEDFLSVIDGLRAIDEVLHFLRFRRGDRLGHALVLGVDPEQYLQMRHNTLLLPKMLVLDDIAWSLNHTACGGAFATAENHLGDIFYRLLREIYGITTSVTLRDYYESWLLRGDNPSRYEHLNTRGIDCSNKVSRWSRFDLNDDSDAMAARENPIARKLYYDYHFNPAVRHQGAKIMELRCPKGTEHMIAELQQQILKQLESMNIGIETNPTSNVRIGGFNRYFDLPVMKFLSSGDTSFRLSASVNTDDRGVFATSIEREYALLACALAKGDNGSQTSGTTCMNMAEICDWLDRIRRNSLTQRFINNQ